MPDRPSWLASLREDIRNDGALGASEQARRESILDDIARRIELEGEHRAQAHATRARQFMPFAALKGYHELAHERERIIEARHEMTEERAAKLSQIIANLSKGNIVSIVHYVDGGYETCCGCITEIDDTFRTIRVVKDNIAFDDIFSIDLL